MSYTIPIMKNYRIDDFGSQVYLDYSPDNLFEPGCTDYPVIFGYNSYDKKFFTYPLNKNQGEALDPIHNEAVNKFILYCRTR